MNQNPTPAPRPGPPPARQADVPPDPAQGAPPSGAGGIEADPASSAGAGDLPATGDVVIDAALRELVDADPGDLDSQVELGERVHRTLQGRLSDLQGQ